MVDTSGATIYLVYQQWACDECVSAHQFYAGEMEWELAHIASTRERAETWLKAQPTNIPPDRAWWWHVTTDWIDDGDTEQDEHDWQLIESWDYRPDGTPISARESYRLYVEPIFGPLDVRIAEAMSHT